MSSIKIGTNQALFHLNSLNKRMDSLTQRLSTGKKINSNEEDPSAWAASRSSHATFNLLQSINSSLDMVAMNVKIADTTMETIGDYIENMKGRLETIVNNDPPFLMDSPQRIEMIDGFNELRGQIDQMTNSSEEGARKIMSDPSVVSDAGDWEVIVGENIAKRTIHSRQVHTGPEGLNISELAETVTDSEIVEAIANLKSAKETLEQKREGLGIDAVGIARWQEHNTKIANFYRRRAEKIENANLDEVAAQIKSGELKRELTIEGIKSITETQATLIEFLKLF